MQAGDGEIIGQQPRLEILPIQGAPLRILAGQRHRQRKDAAPILAPRLPQLGHARLKALLLGPLGTLDAALRQQPLFPQTVMKDSLLRRRAQVTLVIAGPGGGRITLQYAKLGQQFARPPCFLGGQRQVMRPPRVSHHSRATSARIAAGFGFQIKQQVIVATSPIESPSSRQAGNSGTNDQQRRAAGFTRRRQIAVAQTVAQRLVHAEQVAGWQGGPARRHATGQGRGAQAGEEIPTAGAHLGVLPASQTSVTTG